APLASTGAGTGPAIAVAGLLAMAGASLLAAVARTRRHGADPDGLTAD
ncbi:LPXTG cell wall anchor domain-containing protein, partial [Bifidobacterium longum]